ncbi:hypothetical protein [Streptomyces sp. NPDC059743]|uniref:hypothetical protein n=1 Tax=Streptomyces sp. NPDC059743 TaxID=3346928 RepID=UPI003666577C
MMVRPEIKNKSAGSKVFGAALSNNMRAGLRRWVDSNFLVHTSPARTTNRGMMVEPTTTGPSPST